VLSIKPSSIPSSFYPDESSPIPKLPPSHPAIVEWRAMTVIELYALFKSLSLSVLAPIDDAQRFPFISADVDCLGIVSLP
jgi:hypothetical protein